LDTESALNSAIDDQILAELSDDEIELASAPAADIAEPETLSAPADPFDIEAELDEDEFDFLSGSDEASTKLDLARAYIEMDDKDGARDILEEVAAEGNESQKAQAEALLGQL
ncbi:MAG: peptigoglycan-binding protein LysM, partial [Reinekea forsetii]|nr:peptigoglycan-binding protein LysM [Reinekea forsetii]